MRESRLLATLSGLQKKQPVSGSLMILITPSVLTGETIKITVSPFSEEANILYAIQDLCDSHRATRVPLIGQNAQFDTYALRLKDWLSVRFSDDTLLQHHTLYPQLPHNLGFLTSQYTTHPFYKDELDSWKEGGTIDDFWRYNGKDTCITLKCWERMCGGT